MDEDKKYILELFDDLLNVKTKINFHSIAQNIIDSLSNISFHIIPDAFSKDKCIKLFEDAEYSWGGQTTNLGKHYAEEVRDNVCKIL